MRICNNARMLCTDCERGDWSERTLSVISQMLKRKRKRIKVLGPALALLGRAYLKCNLGLSRQNIWADEKRNRSKTSLSGISIWAQTDPSLIL